MIDTQTMISAAVAAVLILAAPPLAWAQQGFNGSVISNTYRNPASGCGYGFGYSGPGCPYSGYVCSASGSCYYRAGQSDGFSNRGHDASTAGAQRPLPSPQH
jgi:hypothetical protein